jgi:acetyl esterase/lipase
MPVSRPITLLLRRPGRTLQSWAGLVCALAVQWGLAGAAQPLHLNTGQDAGKQYVELHLPAQSDVAAPVLLYVPGGFWGGMSERFAAAAAHSVQLTEQGVAVGFVHTRGIPNAKYPAQLQDVAAALAVVRDKAPQLGLDAKRIYLLGHGAGGQLVALLPLRPQVLRKHGLTSADIAGVITLSGIHDLVNEQGLTDTQLDFERVAFGTTPDKRRVASPQQQVHKLPTRYLVLSPVSELSGYVRDAEHFAEAMRAAGNDLTYQILGELDHFSIADLGNPQNRARQVVLDFMGVAPMGSDLKDIVAFFNHTYFEPDRSTTGFWQRYGELVHDYPVDGRFIDRLDGMIAESYYQLMGLPLRTYHAIPLGELVKRLPGKGDYLVTRNIRNEHYYWPIAKLLPYEPVLVVGIDDERNLFRFGSPTRAKREYSWIKPKGRLQPIFRPIGAFVHFRRPAPARLFPHFTAYFSIPVDGLSLHHGNPVPYLDDLPAVVRPAFTYQNGCASCHQFRGWGPRAGHVNLWTGKLQGGYALPLEDYPPAVWRSFVFHQKRNAALIGAIPNMVDPKAQQALYQLVEQSRQQRATAQAGH